jgi:hypothetical protein
MRGAEQGAIQDIERKAGGKPHSQKALNIKK